MLKCNGRPEHNSKKKNQTSDRLTRLTCTSTLPTIPGVPGPNSVPSTPLPIGLLLLCILVYLVTPLLIERCRAHIVFTQKPTGLQLYGRSFGRPDKGLLKGKCRSGKIPIWKLQRALFLAVSSTEVCGLMWMDCKSLVHLFSLRMSEAIIMADKTLFLHTTGNGPQCPFHSSSPQDWLKQHICRSDQHQCGL